MSDVIFASRAVRSPRTGIDGPGKTDAMLVTGVISLSMFLSIVSALKSGLLYSNPSAVFTFTFLTVGYAPRSFFSVSIVSSSISSIFYGICPSSFFILSLAAFASCAMSAAFAEPCCYSDCACAATCDAFCDVASLSVACEETDLSFASAGIFTSMS